ncbi:MULTISPECIES: cache domain-containing sensor histidine kinase [Geobacillus]|jgi:two-component system, sensor histidine kinase YesM|uniref:Sensor histidine kinase n=3 Tax=Geobacillus thermodenitrificans TaxID=33940 RepID=A0ABY9Q746_GEOTD|nr:MULTISPECIES: sensor histidine kinase [Geobacillus]ARA99605.1 histidine kinase [Geobacillus thermodenitrificans]ARP42927.1 putative sensor-like histidine kinase [Geobacillus thermodenitrificans]ATO35812.1 histidine kinase [Geobacillus thermodenitrificans]MED3716362.1 sensor histidine kinase [Geobacillus thermodenitrificans]MED3906896.1 sensor histidine kinase [Geobacillus thermodenitrificans]
MLGVRKRWRVRHWPIRYKFVSLLLISMIVPALGLGGLVSWAVDRIIERQVNENTLQLISQVNRTLEFYVNNMQNITYLIAFNPETKAFFDRSTSSDEYEIRQFLQGITTLYPEIAGILVVNQYGDYISNEMYSRSSQPLTEESWYQEAVKNKGIFKMIGHPGGRNVLSHANYSSEEVVSAVRAILEPETQKVKGVVLIDLKLRVIAEATKNVRLGKWGHLLVIDERGESIYTPSPSPLRTIPLRWVQGNSGTFSKEINGQHIQLIYQRSPFTNWTIIGVFSGNESALEVMEIRFYIISFIFFVCFIALGASYYLSFSLSRPISQLTAFMKKAQAGDLTVRYHDERMDEIGILGRSFNHMLDQMQRFISLAEWQERQRWEAELRELQAQIKPHFLYNTLDTIQWMARKKGADDVAEVVGALAKLFRIGLSKGRNMILFAEEIEHIKSYLHIQKVRYKDKLNYTFDIPEHLQQFYVLKLLLQPIVENAIYHGIKQRRGPGHISIQAEERDGTMYIRVKDDGIGMSRERLEELRKSLTIDFTAGDQEGKMRNIKGYGMVNVQARLQLTFGPSYRLYIDSEEGKGTTVMIVHPMIMNLS